MSRPTSIGELKVCHKQCDQCLYSKNKLVSDKRRAEILVGLAQANDYFICHKSSIVNKKVMCRGYYEANKESSTLIRLGHHLKRLVFVDVAEIMRANMTRKILHRYLNLIPDRHEQTSK